MTKKFFIFWGKLGAYFLAIGLLLSVPTSFFESKPSICLFMNIVGIECMGCGMTRAVSSIFHGDFLRALNYNKLIVVIFPLLSYVAINDIYKGYKSYVSKT